MGAGAAMMVKWAIDGLIQANGRKCSLRMVKCSLMVPLLKSILPSLMCILLALTWSKPA